ncbi:MAG TPA: hypothetical protein VN625_06050 [Desulfuromonadaceae bacterium]|nr:hypothetical protein [Desulfuromonadaceae bacterium]
MEPVGEEIRSHHSGKPSQKEAQSNPKQPLKRHLIAKNSILMNNLQVVVNVIATGFVHVLPKYTFDLTLILTFRG